MYFSLVRILWMMEGDQRSTPCAVGTPSSSSSRLIFPRVQPSRYLCHTPYLSVLTHTKWQMPGIDSP